MAGRIWGSFLNDDCGSSSASGSACRNWCWRWTTRTRTAPWPHTPKIVERLASQVSPRVRADHPHERAPMLGLARPGATVTYDLVIRGGTVVDGSGFDAFRADVGIVGRPHRPTSAASGSGVRQRSTPRATSSRPASSTAHTHMDRQVFWDGLGTWCATRRHTGVMGNCGFTLAPASAEQAPLVVRNLERAEDISGRRHAAGIAWGWTTFAEFLDVLDALPKGIDYAAQIGHSALRTYVMGERAFDDPASADDLGAMEAELRAALRAGAYGFTTSRTRQHRTSDDRPVASRIASLDELTRLVEVVARRASGPSRWSRTRRRPRRRRHVTAGPSELAVRTGVPFAGTAMANATGRASLRAMEANRRRGGPHVRRDPPPRHRGDVVVPQPTAVRPGFRSGRRCAASPRHEQRRQLRDPLVRQELVKAAHDFPYAERVGGEARPADFTTLRVLDTPVPRTRSSPRWRRHAGSIRSRR